VEESFGVYTITIEKMASLQQWVKKLGRANSLQTNGPNVLDRV
jgi:hypothetical protein